MQLNKEIETQCFFLIIPNRSIWLIDETPTAPCQNRPGNNGNEKGNLQPSRLPRQGVSLPDAF